MTVVRAWHRVLREADAAPPLEVFQARLEQWTVKVSLPWALKSLAAETIP